MDVASLTAPHYECFLDRLSSQEYACQTIELSESLSTKKIAIILVVGYIVAGLIFGSCMLCYYDQELDTPLTPTPTRTPTPRTPTPIDEVVIRYSEAYADKYFIDGGDPGNVWLVLDMEIENHGYESFIASPGYFQVIVDHILYDARFCFLWSCEKDELEHTTLMDQGRVSGRVYFEVPELVTNVGYQPRYLLWKSFNVVWIKQ